MRMVRRMTALEVINEIEALDPRQRAEVFLFVRHLEEQEAGHPPAKHMDERRFQKAKEFVFKRHAPLFGKLAE